MSDVQLALVDLMYDEKYAGAQRFATAIKFLSNLDVEEAKKELHQTKRPTEGDLTWNPLQLAARDGAPDELIRAMVARAPAKSIDRKNNKAKTAAYYAVKNDHPAALETLLTLGADPRGCRELAQRFNLRACLTVLDRFEQRATLACCLRHYDQLQKTSPVVVHLEIAALVPHAKILHDLDGIDGDLHSITRKILSCI
jgi:hypothetical protein